jgi:DNA-binding CsgD family transcriptional regulator
MRSLTPRQRQVIAQLARGRSNLEVAAALGISPRTAKAHTDEIRRRLGVEKRRQILYAYFVETGELPIEREAPSR